MKLKEFDLPTKERIAKLTEKYLLINENNVISFKLKNSRIKIIDFSDLTNLKIAKRFIFERIQIQIIINVMQEQLIEKKKTNGLDESFVKWVEEGTLLITDSMENIIHNIFDENDMNEIEYLADLADVKNNADLLQLVLDLCNCIDLAIYSGFKYALENEDKMKEKFINEIKKHVNVDTEDKLNFVIETFEEDFSFVKETLLEKEDINYDLSNMTTIGNA